ncbi:MAG: hypothetical protein K0Q89_379 [Thermomicrobiales bacterium]|nr:hypothetical protein [Thermomicrobiales bacterium]
MTDSELVPADLMTAARVCRETLALALARDWSVPAGDLEWDCRRTLDHIVDTLFLYAAYLASRGTERISPPRNGDPSASPAQLLATVVAAAAVLTDVARAAPPGTRAFHPAGMADVSGWIGMGCAEVLVHTDDIARGGRRAISTLGTACAGPPGEPHCPTASNWDPIGTGTVRRFRNGTGRSGSAQRRRHGSSDS